jgi:hypothetical protein
MASWRTRTCSLRTIGAHAVDLGNRLPPALIAAGGPSRAALIDPANMTE